MSNSVVNLFVNDNGFNAKIRNAAKVFASLGGAAINARAQFSKFADSIGQVTQMQQAFNTAVKGNPYGLLAQAATVAFTKIVEKATEATDAEKRAMEWAQVRVEREQEINDAIGKSTGELLAKYEMLRIEWNTLSSDQQRNDWIKNNQSAFKNLNLAVDGVTSAENVFVNNTNKVVEALKARAEAEAYGELYKEQIKKYATNKASGKYNVQLITDPYYRPSETEAQLAGFTQQNKHENFEYKWVENADPRNPGKHREWTGRLTQIGLDRLNENRQKLGSSSLENADRMLAEQYLNQFAAIKLKANELSNNNLFGNIKNTTNTTGNNNLPDIEDWNKAFNKSLLDTDKLKEGKELLSPYNMMLGEIKKNILDIQDLDLGGAMADLGNQEVLDQIEAATKRIEQQKKATELAAQAAINLGSALSGVEDPGLRAAGTVMSAIANIALGFGQAAAQASSLGPYAWAAWLVAGTAAMATAISTVHSLTGYSHGGIVQGNSYSGDNIFAGGGMVNAGELVLTKAQQSSLANQLEGGGMSGLGPSRISGEQIYITLNRYLKRSGQGELMTWG